MRYPDYDQYDWTAAVAQLGDRGDAAADAVAQALAAKADWSLQGIEASQRELAKAAGVSQKTVAKAIARLETAGLIDVARRQRKAADAYRLTIPGGPVWDYTPDIAVTSAADIPLECCGDCCHDFPFLGLT